MIVDKVVEIQNIYRDFVSEDKQILGFFPIPDKDKIKRYITKGRWPILIIDTHPKLDLAHGLRISPKIDAMKWPIYELTQVNTAFLLAPDILSYVNFIHYRTLSRIKGKYEKYQSEWEQYQKVLTPLFSHFDNAEKLNELYDYAFNNKYWPSESQGTLSDEAYISFMKRNSDSEAVDFFVSLISQINEHPDWVPSLPDFDTGIWENRIYNIIGEISVIKATNDNYSSVIEKQIFEYFKQPHGYDTEDIDVKLQPNDSASAKQQYWHLVNGLISNPNREHNEGLTEQPEYRALLAIKQKGMGGYQGVEHIEAAAILDSEMNEPMRAWNCLVSAGYWAGLNKPELQETIMEAAIYLCRKHGWAEAADAVQYNLDIYKS